MASKKELQARVDELMEDNLLLFDRVGELLKEQVPPIVRVDFVGPHPMGFADSQAGYTVRPSTEYKSNDLIMTETRYGRRVARIR